MKDKKAIWWHEYRKRLYKVNVRNLSFETILRKVLKKTLREYSQNSSLSGVQQMTDPNINIKKRIMRIVLFCGMFCSIFYFLQYFWFNNLARPPIVTLESSTYPISKIEFPAVTLCNFNRISKKALENHVKKHYSVLTQNNESIADVEWFYKQLGRLLDYSYDKTLQINPLFLTFAKHLGDTNNIIALMEELSPPCEEMLLRCAWAGEIVDCATLFTVKRTVRGHCCAFNLVVANDQPGEMDTNIYTVKRQYRPGLLQGLNIILDPMVDDYTYSILNMLGFEVFIFDPTHFADPTGGRVIQRTAQPNQSVYFEVRSIKQVSTREVRKYPPKTRKCLFRDELKDKYNGLYSYSACLMRCRVQTIRSLCQCTPYYFPTLTNEGPICTLDDLRCLQKHKEKLLYLFPKDAINTEGLEAELQDSLYCEECLPDCELVQHSTKHSKIPLSYAVNGNKEFRSFFFDGINKTNKCMLSIYQATTDGVLNRLDIVSYWFEILSNVGGICGVLLGFSIISIFEIVYYFIFKSFINLYDFYYNNT